MSFLNINDDQVELDDQLSALLEGENNSTPNPPENTPEPVPTRDIITATQYTNKSSDGTTVASVVSIEGTSWSTVYFNQVLGTDDYPRQLDVGLDPSLQQYIRIKGFAVYIQGSMDMSRDNQTGIHTLSGIAQSYPGVTVQPGDMFIGKLDDGRTGLMVVGNDIKELNLTGKSAYEWDFKLYNYAKEQYLTNLDIKTIKTFNYNEEGAACGNPLISQEELDVTTDSNDLIYELVNMYYDQFFTKEVSTFALKEDNGDLVYDGNVTEFFTRMVSKDNRGVHPRANIYTVESLEYRDRIETIWDVLISGIKLWKNRINRTFEVRPTEDFRSPYTYNHLSSSAFTSVISPTHKASLVKDNPDESDDFYVFTEAFYDNDLSRTSSFESTVIAAISGTYPSMDKIIEMIEDMQLLSDKERFYQIPIIVWLLLKIIG